MKTLKIWVVMGMLATTGLAGWGGTIGLWKDGRSHITDGMLKTLQDAGWQTTILTNLDLSSESKLAGLDVIFLPGGWNAMNFADYNARRNLVKFVAGGKGILAGAFRSGYVRTANRPLFPQVGAVYNRVSGPYISAYGDSDLAKAIDQPFCPGGWDHLVVKTGPLGRVFAVSGEDTVGVYGKVYGGRYLIFGAFIGMDAKTNAMEGTARNVLLKSIEWLAAAPKLTAADKSKQEAQADLDFMRREKLHDWTLNERGPDRGPGIIPELRNAFAIPLESRQYTLQYMSQYLSGRELEQCRAAEAILKKAMEALDDNFRKLTTEITSTIGKMTIGELVSENPFIDSTNVVKMIEATSDKTDEENKIIIAALTSEYAPKMTALYLHGDSIRERLMPEARLKDMIKGADKVLSELRPIVKAAKAEKTAQERKQDLAAVPDLIEKFASPDPAVRRDVILELGRIGSLNTALPLVKALKDADEKVRLNAVLGLGWMQAREAVPALIEMAGGDDLNMRSRALQALGQIGDSRAIPVLTGNINHKNHLVAENSILASGWLKAKAVVPELLKIVTTLDPQNGEERVRMLAAIRALGHIGETNALPVLAGVVAATNDFPVSRRTGKQVVNPYSTPQPLGLNWHAQLAIAEIKTGGRGEIGIKQADGLSAKDKFYGLTRRFNALAGRSFDGIGTGFKEYPQALWPYLWEAGFTGIHQAWGEQDSDPGEYVELIRTADEFDLRWIDVMPIGIYIFGMTQPYTNFCQLGVEKAGAELVLMKYQDEPSFQGFWTEETYPEVTVPGPEFEAWLRNKYGADFRGKLGVSVDLDIAGKDWISWKRNEYHGPLKAEFMQLCAEKMLGAWRESQEWLHGLRKGCAFTFSISIAELVKHPGVSAKAGTVIDVIGPESYQSFGRYNSFVMEMHKDGEARPVMSEFYNMYTPSPAHEVRGFAQHLMHGECFYNFHLSQIFDQAFNYYMWSWDSSRWTNFQKMFQKARKIREYLDVPASAANVALMLSDLSCLPFDPPLYGASLPFRWDQHQSALWTALNQSQIPTDIIWTDTLTREKLTRYRVIVLSDAKIITADQAQLIRDWVNKGGVLIASGLTSLFNQWAEQQKNYLLSDVFGVSYLGYAGVDDSSMIDTYCWEKGGQTVVKAVSGLDPENFRTHVHRDVKPVKSLGTYTVSDKDGKYLPDIAPGTSCEYDMPLGYDRVKESSAEVMARFSNGDPALTVNKVGQGVCYFWTPIYPGLCHVTSDWEMQPNRLDFWPNVRELLGAMVKGGLADGKSALPVEVSGVSTEVEVTVRQQSEFNRWMIHVLNYDPRVDLVKKPMLTVHPPKDCKVKRIYYPDTGTEVSFTANAHGVTARMRDFDVHDMLVVELQ